MRYVIIACSLVWAVMAQETVRREVRSETISTAQVGGFVAGGHAVHFMAAGPAAGKVVTGAPYTADSVTEYVRTLADGTRITRRTHAKFARDSQGRTRDEQALPGLGPWASGEAVKMVTIFDPVAKEMYILNEKEKTARKVKFSGNANGNMTWTSSSASPVAGAAPAGGTREVRVERRVLMNGGPPPPLPPPSETAIALPAMAATDVMIRRGDVKQESLGTQTMEGVQVQGSRTTRTVPAGEMGNDRPLISTEERWESTELKTLVRSTAHDPEFGDTTFRLNNLNRSEPARSLFQIPADYRLEEGPQAFRVEVRDKQ